MESSSGTGACHMPQMVPWRFPPTRWSTECSAASAGTPQSRRIVWFALLREADDEGAKTIYVEMPSKEGIGLAVYNRASPCRGIQGDRGMSRLIVGLTGMSGAGKSTVCRAFAERGFDVIDCDLSAREVVQPGRPALTELHDRLSPELILQDGTLDRRKTGGAYLPQRGETRAVQQNNLPLYYI